MFRTQADAELTKAIYRRVPILWREGQGDRPEANPWRLKFLQGLFNMSSDSHHFRTAAELQADGYSLEGNVFVSAYDRYLPLYEAKMLHQFDHRWATYDGDDARDVTDEEKRDLNFVAQPRYWVREEVTESAIPKYPEPLALAVQLNDRGGMQRVLSYWVAGHHLNRGNDAAAQPLLDLAALPRDVDGLFTSWLGRLSADKQAKRLEQDFPLSQGDLDAIAAHIKDSPEEIARELLDRFSPKWFLGWRDICRSTDERTLIASVLPRVAVGNKIPLYISTCSPSSRLALAADLNSLVCDFCARQKIGGTTFNFFIMKQVAVADFSRPHYGEETFHSETLQDWVACRVLELLYTADDLTPLAREFGYDGPPFSWNFRRRFEIRCELDAAFFHLYLPATPRGQWRVARMAEGNVVDETKKN